jgi:hypothetical protein
MREDAPNGHRFSFFASLRGCYRAESVSSGISKTRISKARRIQPRSPTCESVRWPSRGEAES